MYDLLPYILTNESTKYFTAKFTKGFVKGLGNTTATLTVLGLLSGGWYIYNNGIHIINVYNSIKTKKLKKSKSVNFMKNDSDSILFYEKENLKDKHQYDSEDQEDCASYENSNLVDIEKDYVEDTKYKKLLEKLF